jgi:predicted ferric reductase
MVTVAGIWRILIYLAFVFSPLYVTAIFHFKSADNLTANIGRCLGLLAFGLLIMQVSLTARLKWTEKPFGLNLMVPFHRRMGIFVTGILITHPLLMAASGDGWPLLIGLNQPWNIWIAKGALLLLLINSVLSVYRVPLGLKFESWRLLHNLLGPTIILSLVFLHSWFTGSDLDSTPMRGPYYSLAIIASSDLGGWGVSPTGSPKFGRSLPRFGPCDLHLPQR